MKYLCGNCFCESVNEQGICTRCGYDCATGMRAYPLALRPGTILYGRYILGRVLGQGGFGITYVAQEYQTGKRYAIKEYFPDSMATRSGNGFVRPYSGERGEHFSYGKKCFLEEAQTVSRFNGNPNIAEVYLYFEENGTAYFVMEYVEGLSLRMYLKSCGGRVFWDDAVAIMTPVLDALAAVHEQGIVHRDVTPDNIIVRKDGTIKLLDFGAARYSLGNVSKSLDVVLKHGFAPREQYSRRGRQGPYTDVYTACATLYFATTGIKPMDAIERTDQDRMPRPSQLGVSLTPAQESILLKGLAVKPGDRYQNAGALRDALLSARKVPSGSGTPATEKTVTEIVGGNRMLIGALALGAVALVLLLLLLL